MGRYAFFSTGFEYKFRFALQSTEDILKFGGVNIGIDNHHWDASDVDYIEDKLNNLEILTDIDPIDIKKFPFTLEGTRDLYMDCFKEGCKSEEYVEYLLGTLILHQLQYVAALECEYEW